ncbi:MAG: hypothetical protein LiPW30_767 [Parcubacteria group bacterium LiPW_30]|nr:MAG: hypothetical protein LiPW30_767 [Parcubacteria group bacterium LiPW_30]
MSTLTRNTDNNVNEENLLRIVRKSVKEVCKYIMELKSLRAIIRDGPACANEYVEAMKGINIHGCSGVFRKQIGILFTITTPVDLNQEAIPDELRLIFAQNGHELSPRVTVKICKPDCQWQIYDHVTKATYQISKAGTTFTVSQKIQEIAKREAREWQEKLQEAQQQHGERSWDDGVCPNCGSNDLFVGEVAYAKVQTEIERMRRKQRESAPSP